MERKGIEYVNNEDKIIIISEYKEGKIWNSIGKKNENLEFELKEGNGKLKEYNNEGKLIFEGKYKNGQRWAGKGKEYI